MIVMPALRIDAREIKDLGNMLAAAGRSAPHAIRRAVNHTGDRARTVVSRALAKQTGASYGAVRKALTTRRANFVDPRYVIIARGPHMSLKDFKPRRTRKGVSAAPWNERRVFEGTFMVGSMGGHVFVRTSKKRFPLKKLWGPALPKEMVKDATADAFTSLVMTALPARIAHELYRVIQ